MGQVQVVITTRDQAFARVGESVSVGLFTPEQSAGYLDRRTGLVDTGDACAIADDQGHLPVALAQAATVISEQAWDYATYRERLRSAPAARSLARHAGDPYPRGAVEAIALAVSDAAARDHSGLTRTIIALLAVLSAEGVTRPVLAGLPSVPEAASLAAFPPAWDDALDKVLGRLVNPSILTCSGSGLAFSMRRVVRKQAVGWRR